MSTAIVVLGGHRCGTSCVAGILHHLGVPMGKELLGPGHGNPKGHFEDVAFFHLHLRILGENQDGNAWRQPTPDGESFRDAYRSLVARRNLDHDVWGVKDPRLCFLLPLLLAAHDGDIRLIHVDRDPRDAARSLRARGGDAMPEAEAEAIAWAYHKATQSSLVLAARRGPTLRVAFDRLVDDPREVVAEIAEFVQIPHERREARFETAVRFVDPNANHWRSN